jgi:hypothetical protein
MREVVPRETDEAARESQEAEAAARAARQAAARKSAMKAVEALRQQRREVAAAPVDTWQSEEAKRTNASLFNEDNLQYCST